MTQVLDYSAGFPGALAIAGSGYVGAVRYIGFPANPKCTTANELVDFSHNGLGMALVFEDQVASWRRGFAGGQADARVARTHATSIGFPAGCPIYYTIDQQAITSDDHALAVRYIQGAASVEGIRHTGVYGQFSVMQAVADAGTATYFWQSTAWSGGQRYAGAMLFQQVATVFVNGIACDVNDVLAPDWGHHSYVPIIGTHRTTMEDHIMQLPPGTGMSQTLTYPGQGYELVINIGWVPFTINKISFIGRTPATGVNWAGQDFGQHVIDPARPLVIDLDQYPAAVSIEIDYDAPDTKNWASAGFRPKQ